jgi:hypothetical protein
MCPRILDIRLVNMVHTVPIHMKTHMMMNLDQMVLVLISDKLAK